MQNIYNAINTYAIITYLSKSHLIWKNTNNHRICGIINIIIISNIENFIKNKYYNKKKIILTYQFFYVYN